MAFRADYSDYTILALGERCSNRNNMDDGWGGGFTNGEGDLDDCVSAQTEITTRIIYIPVEIKC